MQRCLTTRARRRLILARIRPYQPPPRALSTYGVAFPATGAQAASAPCLPFSAVGQTEATSPGGPFVGTVDVTLGDASYRDVPIVTTVLAPLAPAGGSGVAFTSTSHSIA